MYLNGPENWTNNIWVLKLHTISFYCTTSWWHHWSVVSVCRAVCCQSGWTAWKSAALCNMTTGCQYLLHAELSVTQIYKGKFIIQTKNNSSLFLIRWCGFNSWRFVSYKSLWLFLYTRGLQPLPSKQPPLPLGSQIKNVSEITKCATTSGLWATLSSWKGVISPH